MNLPRYFYTNPIISLDAFMEITISLSALLFYHNHSFFFTIHHLASGGILVGIAELLLEFYAYHWTLPPKNAN